MSAFRYEAARRDGVVIRGVINASSGAEAAATLSDRGLFPIAVKASPARPRLWRRSSTRAQATVFQSLASLVDAGCPLDQALTVTASVAGPLREAVSRVTERVRQGGSLAGSLESEAGLFSPIAVGLTRAGERGVGLATGLAAAAAQLERDAETNARVRSALAYPLLLLVAGTASVALIAFFVVPRFAGLLADLGQELPRATRVLLTGSHLLRSYGALLLGLLALGIAAGVGYTRQRETWWHNVLLRLPLVGPVRHALATSRVCRALAALLGSGTPALTALDVARASVGDAATADRLDAARARVAEGQGIADALSGTRALTQTALELVTVGERSGRLPVLLAKAAALEEQGAERQLKTVIGLLEPALIVVFAGLVAFVAAALLQAVYAVRSG